MIEVTCPNCDEEVTLENPLKGDWEQTGTWVGECKCGERIELYSENLDDPDWDRD